MISKRLQIIANWISKSKVIKILDLGTDHGGLAYTIAKHQPNKQIWASDVKQHIIAKLKNNPLFQTVPNLNFVVSNGLQMIKPPIDLVILAGIGVNTIKRILTTAPFTVSEYITQTKQNPTLLRKWFYEQGYGFLKDQILFDKNQFYHILWVVKSKGQKFNLSQIDYGNFPRVNNQVFWNYWKKQLLLLQAIYPKITNAVKQQQCQTKIKTINQLINHEIRTVN